MAGPQLALNTADFQLVLGGRYLLESAGVPPDGYLLEDGSGVLLLDCYTPQLGDPVVFTNPAWTGRVVNVERRNIVQHKINYLEATIGATNTAVATVTTPPGDFADTAIGGHYQMEDGLGSLLLEGGTDLYGFSVFGIDVYGFGSGYYMLEGSAFPYRNLQVKQSQNQDGSVTTYGSLETFESGYAAGQTFALTNTDQGYNAQSFTITNVRIDWVGAQRPTALYTIEFGDAYQTLQLAGGGVLTRTASTATQALGVAMPGGVLGYAEVTATQGTFTALTDITGLAVTVTVASGRRIKISCKIGATTSVAGDVAQAFIYEGATLLQNTSLDLRLGSGIYSAFSVVKSPTAGVHTYKIAMTRLSGTGNITMQADPTFPAYIMVEDAGT